MEHRTITFELDDFTLEYLSTAMWADTPEDFDKSQWDDPRDSIGYESLMRAYLDCQVFQRQISRLDTSKHDDSQMAHDFWLTRQGHGAGFWDGDYKEPLATELTKLAKWHGTRDLYIGDNGKVSIG